MLGLRGPEIAAVVEASGHMVRYLFDSSMVDHSICLRPPGRRYEESHRRDNDDGSSDTGVQGGL